MKETAVAFESDGLKLEGLLALNGSPDAHAAVVCHPHPQYGGSMHNDVVEAVLEAFQGIGYSTLRFNFRGVGASEGTYGGGEREVNDAIAAVRFISSRLGARVSRCVLAGYSFGALVACKAGYDLDGVTAIVAVAPPIGLADFSFLCRTPRPVALVCGDRDGFCARESLEQLHRGLTGRKAIRIVSGADHFFGGFEADLNASIRSAYAEIS